VAQTGIDYGNADLVFANAPNVIAEEFRLSKGGGHSIEPRGVLARYDHMERLLTVWDSTQMPHRAKAILVDALGLQETQVRVITPDVGGGFGPKAVFHPEELAIPAAALLLNRPVKWAEDRFESFTATCGERDQIWTMEVAFTNEGKLLGLRGRLRYDHGASTPYGIALPFNAATNLIGPYVLPAYKIQIDLCLTNKTPSAPTRGAGRPQGTFVMERLLDRMARRLDLPRDEIRRRNLITPEQMPYAIPVRQRDGSTMEYDTGDYPRCQAHALNAAGWSDFPERQAEASRQGRFIGLGLSNYVEATGRGPFESVAIRIGPSGQIVVATGATAQGQGVKTMIAQIVADVLALPASRIEVVTGDTAATPAGLGAYASRQAVTAGNAAHATALLVAEKIKLAGAALLEAAPEDLELADGMVRVKGAPDHAMSFANVARALAGTPGFALPANLPPGLAAANDYLTTGLTYTNGVHLAEVEVDAATGSVKILRYIVVHDCGRMINPMMVEGQVIGGVVHGIGAALFEWMRYDEEGQPLSVTYADYLLPTADVAPRIEIHHMESPTPLNPLGVKGAAESGTIGAPSAIASAIEDALRMFDVQISDLPITPPRLLALIRAGSAA
jgi:carbon-monoxide dehydrogenase large subunit